MAMKKKTVPKQKAVATQSWFEPAFMDHEEDADKNIAKASRSRAEAPDSPQQSYPNLDKFPTPFRTGDNSSFLDASEAIRLCVKAYWAFPLLRNVVEVMGELSNSNVYLQGGSKKSRDFIAAWFEKINLWHLKEQFFREWFRSGNCFLYRFDGKIADDQLKKMTQTFGASATTLPIKYVVLNPEMLTAHASIMFSKPVYYKTLTSFELNFLRNNKDKADVANFLNSLTPEEKKSIMTSASGGSVTIALSVERLYPMLYKAQSYEPMGVPMAFGVLKDIEAKLELKRIDLSIARTTDRAMLLMNIGEPENEWNKGRNINPATAESIKNIFANESVARTLVVDHTVKGDWLIPDINKILGQEKYRQLDQDINIGLNAILFDSGEKFANTSIKVQVFVERLKEARQAFLQNFLQPEIKRVCKEMGNKNYPTAVFEELSLKDELQYAKLAVSMAQAGLLTPEELFKNLKTGEFPLPEDSVESQTSYKDARQKDLYLPLLGGASELTRRQIEDAAELGKEANAIAGAKAVAAPGRPTGTTGPKASSTPSPIGTSKASQFSVKLLQQVSASFSSLNNLVEKSLREKWNVKRMTDKQKNIAKEITASIASNESEEKWESCIAAYLDSPKDVSDFVKREIEDIQIAHDIDFYSAAMLRQASVTTV